MNERRVRGYVLREKIGSGGVGEVYRAYQDFVERDVAIKVIGAQYANDPNFVRRFHIEAQTIARLEHPHIVPLYDYWRDPDGAYLVMRWVQGGNIRHALNREGAWSLPRVLSVVSQVGSAIAFSHRRNVIHRDLKPENILLDIESNAYVTDFGIAIDLQEKKLFDENISYGSPFYAAPEQFSERVVTPQADVYSMGILIFEMLTGEAPFEGDSTLEVLRKQFHVPLPSVRNYRADIPFEIDHVLQRATEKDWQLRYTDVMHMLRDLRAIVGDDEVYEVPSPQPSLGLSDKQLAVAYETRQLTSKITATNTVLLSAEIKNPYKGLQAFTEVDATDFFGRDDDIHTLLQRLKTLTPRFLAVVGASGSGKSSLVRAGLFPALRRGRVDGSEDWFIAEMSPGRNPMRALEEALLRVAVRAGDTLNTLLEQGGDGLVQAAQVLLPKDAVLLLYIDQFEEVFTLLRDATVRERFLSLLYRAATNETIPIYVLVTLRADFYDRPLVYPDFARLLRQATHVVLPLDEEQLVEVIVNPAQRVGVNFEPNLEKVIVADVQQQTNALPLLQYTLSEMFEMRDEENYIMHETYEAIGGVMGALAKRADMLYGAMPTFHQQIARQLLLQLVILNEDAKPTRQRMAVHDVMSAFGEQDAQVIMDAFVDHRLLTYDRDPYTRLPTVEIAHEALLYAWEPLQAWIKDSRDALRVRQRLDMALMDWRRAGEDRSFLATGTRLSEFEALLSSEWLRLSVSETRYLERSMQLRQSTRQRRQLVIGLISVIAVVAVVLAVFATYLQRQAVAAQRVASIEANKSKARELAVLSQMNLQHTDLAMLLGVSSLRYRDTFEGRQSLLLALQRTPYLVRYLHGHEGDIRSVAALGDWVVTGGEDGQVRRWDITAGAMIGQPLTGHTGAVNAVAVSTMGAMIASGDARGDVRVWDAETGDLQASYRLESGVWALDYGLSRLAVGDEQGNIHLWAADEKLDTWPAHDEIIYAVRFSEDEQYLATGGDDDLVRVWDVETGDRIHTLTEHNNWVLSVAFSPDGAVLASSDADAVVFLWDVESGEEIAQLETGHDGWVRSIAFDPTGRFLFTSSLDGTVRVWDWATGEQFIKPLTGHTQGIWSLALLPDPLRIVTGGNDKHGLVWDLSTPQPIIQQRVTLDHDLFTMASHGDVLAVGGGLQAARGEGGKVYLLATQTGEILHTLNNHLGAVLDLDMTEQYLVSSSLDETVVLWDIETGEPVQRFEGSSVMYSIALTPSRLYATTEDDTLLIWDISSGAFIDEWTMDEELSEVAVQGDLLVLGYRDGRLEVRRDGFEPVIFDGHEEAITSVSFAQDGRYVVSGSRDGTVRVWDVETGQSDGTPLRGHQDWVLDVAVHPSGEYLVSAGRDGRLMLWDWTRRQPIGTPLVAHVGAVTDVTFYNDMLLSIGQDGQIVQWDSTVAQWMARACVIANRDFYNGEWEQFFDVPREQVAVCGE